MDFFRRITVSSEVRTAYSEVTRIYENFPATLSDPHVWVALLIFLTCVTCLSYWAGWAWLRRRYDHLFGAVVGLALAGTHAYEWEMWLRLTSHKVCDPRVASLGWGWLQTYRMEFWVGLWLGFFVAVVAWYMRGGQEQTKKRKYKKLVLAATAVIGIPVVASAIVVFHGPYTDAMRMKAQDQCMVIAGQVAREIRGQYPKGSAVKEIDLAEILARIPESEDWIKKVAPAVFQDAWGKAIDIRLSAGKDNIIVTAKSRGQDGEWGTRDDIQRSSKVLWQDK